MVLSNLRCASRITTLSPRIIRHRQFASASSGAPAFQVFNRDVKRQQKDRAALQVEASRTVDYLRDEVAARVADRLLVSYCRLRLNNCDGSHS